MAALAGLEIRVISWGCGRGGTEEQGQAPHCVLRAGDLALCLSPLAAAAPGPPLWAVAVMFFACPMRSDTPSPEEPRLSGQPVSVLGRRGTDAVTRDQLMVVSVLLPPQGTMSCLPWSTLRCCEPSQIT